MNYFDDPVHATLSHPYMPGSNGGFVLGFTQAWKDAHLPPGIGDPAYVHGEHQLRTVLLDRLDKRLHETKMSVAYNHKDFYENDWLDTETWAPAAVRSLQSYFYACHHCPCHRKQDVREQCKVDVDDECEGNRFLIERVTPVNQPDLILYSEMYDDAALDALLAEHRRAA